MADKKFILIAEDDPAYVSVYKAKLEGEGFEVKVVTHGEDVIPELKKRKPDLVLLDLLMPGKNGFENLADIKADPDLKDLKCIVASNLSQEVDRKKVLASGAVDFFVKSDVSISEMVTKIKEYL